MKRREGRLIALLTTVVFVLAFLLSGRLWFRLDLTMDKSYTISEASQNLYKEITDRVTITYFVSDRLCVSSFVPGEISDLLREYAAHSQGKIRFIQKDPMKAELLNVVEELGIVPQQIQVVEKNEATIATVYTGILIEYLDRAEVIPVVFSLDTLEYDLSSRIRALVRNTGRELGVMVGDAHKQWQGDYSLLNRELVLSGFRVRLINPTEDIPPELPAVFILGGAEDLDEDSLSRIDRYIKGGGRALFAVNGVFVDTRGGLEARSVRDGGLLAMLADYGAVIRPALLLDRTALTLTFQTQSGNGTIIRSVRYPEWIGVHEENGSPDHPITARFGGLDLYWASPLELSPPPGVSADILFYSTDDAWLQTENYITNPNLISQFENEALSTRGKKILAASFSGVFSSDGSIGNSNGSSKTSRIIVIGDSNFAGSLMQVSRGERRNLEFLIRAAEWLSGDDDIISIRSRVVSQGRLNRITDPEKRDAVMAFSRILNTIFIPAGVIIAGLFIVGKRKAKTAKEKYGVEV